MPSTTQLAACATHRIPTGPRHRRTLQYPLPFVASTVPDVPGAGDRAEQDETHVDLVALPAGKLAAAFRFLALQKTPRDLSRAVTRALPDIALAQRARLFFYSEEADEIWHEGDTPADDVEGGGLALSAARSRDALTIDRAGNHPCYRRDLDDPSGSGGERILAEVLTGSDGSVHGVVLVMRAAADEPFGLREACALRQFASMLSPLVEAHHLSALQEEAEPQPAIFRPQALAAARQRDREGRTVRRHSRLVEVGFGMLAAVFVVGISLAFVVDVDEFAEGRAIVLADQRVELVAEVEGRVDAILARPGQRVRAGDALLRVDAPAVADALRQARAEFDRRLAERLVAPRDPSTHAPAAAAARAFEDARAAADRLTLRASRNGRIGEILIDVGHNVQRGAPLVSLTSDHGGERLVVALPASQQHRVRVGAMVRLSLDGVRGGNWSVRISQLSREALAPQAAAQQLGAGVAETLELRGPVVLAELELPDSRLTLDGAPLALHHGQQGTARIRLDATPVIASLIPALKEVL